MGRKEQILKAAYEIVGRAGIEGLHARTVAADIGINHAAVHYYFRTRSDLIAALVDYTLLRFEQDRERLLLKAKTKQERIDAIIAQARAYARPESRFAKNWASFFVASIADPTLKAKLVQGIQEWIEGLSGELDAVGRRDQDPILSAEVMAATLIGIVVMSHACGEAYPSGKALQKLASKLTAA